MVGEPGTGVTRSRTAFRHLSELCPFHRAETRRCGVDAHVCRHHGAKEGRNHNEDAQYNAGSLQQPFEPAQSEQSGVLEFAKSLSWGHCPRGSTRAAIDGYREGRGQSRQRDNGEEVRERGRGALRVSAPKAKGTMTTTFSPPLSGVLLNFFIEALDLRAFDPERTLRDRTAQRYLHGERVSPEAEAKIQAAFADALVAADLVPRSMSAADLLPGLPSGAAHVPPAAIISVILRQYTEHWDLLAGGLRRLTAPVAYPRHAAGACLRLVAIDLALRITAILWLSGEQGPLLDFWSKPQGVSHWLRELTKRAGVTRDELARRSGIPENTVDDWLDNNVRPESGNLARLAKALAPDELDREAMLRRQLRVTFAAREVCTTLEQYVGRKQAQNLCQRVVSYANQMLCFVRGSVMSAEENSLKMRFTRILGASRDAKLPMPWIEFMLRHLWRREEDPVWRTSLTAATGSWFDHLQGIAALLGPVDRTKLAEVLGREPSDEDLDVLAYLVQASHLESTRQNGWTEVTQTVIANGGEHAAQMLMHRAREAHASGDRFLAIKLLRAAAAEDPTCEHVHFRLGCHLWQVGESRAALDELELAVQLEPQWDRPRVEIAIVLLYERRDQEALAKLLCAKTELESATEWLLLHIGYAHERLGQTLEAINAYEELVALHEGHAEALDRVAHLHFLASDKRLGAERAKQAAHFGVPTVLRAWQSGYYNGHAVGDRPRHSGLDHVIVFPDSAWIR